MVLLLAFGYSGLKMVVTTEHRLLEIQTELELARHIQASILPTAVPVVRDLQISALYQPMRSVAGDFYEFVPLDSEHVGVFVADVCGHGIPAALIASMLKMAVQSADASSDQPDQFLGTLNRVLVNPLHGQLVSASYLWLDMRTRQALYSAAGHPPMLRFNKTVERIESNGLLFGLLPNAEYPVRKLPLNPGDRLVLYTDGVTEPENVVGQSFGDTRLHQVLTDHSADTPADLTRLIVTEIQKWQRTPEPQDDITLVVIDVG